MLLSLNWSIHTWWHNAHLQPWLKSPGKGKYSSWRRSCHLWTCMYLHSFARQPWILLHSCTFSHKKEKLTYSTRGAFYSGFPLSFSSTRQEPLYSTSNIEWIHATLVPFSQFGINFILHFYFCYKWWVVKSNHLSFWIVQTSYNCNISRSI